MSIYDRLLLGKNEATKGTGETPTAGANAIRVNSFDVSVDTTKIERSVVKDTWGQLPHDIGKQMMTLTVEFELKGSGTAGTAPAADAIFSCCGLLGVNSAGTSEIYKLSTDLNKSSTFWAYKDGLLFKFIGATGKITGSYAIGEHIRFTAEIMAPYLAPTAVSVPSGASYQSSQPLEFSSSATVTVGGTAIKVGSLSFDFGTEVAEHYTTGEHVFEQSGAQPTITISKDSVGTAAEWTALTAATTAVIIVIVSGGAGNIVTLRTVDARRDSVGYGERDNRDLHEITWSLYESSGDDQLAIEFT